MTKAALRREAVKWTLLAEAYSLGQMAFIEAIRDHWNDDMTGRFLIHMAFLADTNPATADPILDMLWLAQECREEAR